VQSTPEQMADWNKFMSGVEDATDPFKKTLKTTLGSLLSPKKALENAPQRVLESYTTSALTNLVGGGAKQPEQPGPRAAFAPIGADAAMAQNQFLAQTMMTADPLSMGQSSVIADGIRGEMSIGQQGGYFGNSFAFPGANFGFATT